MVVSKMEEDHSQGVDLDEVGQFLIILDALDLLDGLCGLLLALRVAQLLLLLDHAHRVRLPQLAIRLRVRQLALTAAHLLLRLVFFVGFGSGALAEVILGLDWRRISPGDDARVGELEV
jgi:hypothetical protein